jgi:hypothetical protein
MSGLEPDLGSNSTAYGPAAYEKRCRVYFTTLIARRASTFFDWLCT